MDDIEDVLLHGYVHVIDADLSKYFETIPHDKLLKTVAEKIVDKNILSLLKLWLIAIVIKIENGQLTNEITEYFGLNHYRSVSGLVKRFEYLLQEDRSLARRVNCLLKVVN